MNDLVTRRYKSGYRNSHSRNIFIGRLSTDLTFSMTNCGRLKVLGFSRLAQSLTKRSSYVITALGILLLLMLGNYSMSLTGLQKLLKYVFRTQSMCTREYLTQWQERVRLWQCSQMEMLELLWCLPMDCLLLSTILTLSQMVRIAFELVCRVWYPDYNQIYRL